MIDDFCEVIDVNDIDVVVVSILDYMYVIFVVKVL